MAAKKANKKRSAAKKKSSTARSRVAEVAGVMDADGKVSRTRDPGLSKERLLEIYRAMIMTRVVEDRGAQAAASGPHRLLPAVRRPGGVATSALPRRWRTATGSSRPIASPASSSCVARRCEEVVDEWYGNDGDICKGGQMPVPLLVPFDQLRLDQLADRHADEPRCRCRHGCQVSAATTPCS
jgi:hypothetical protein